MPSTNFRRAGIAALATTSLALGGIVAGTGAAYAEADFDLVRIKGEDRYDTSAKTATEFGTAKTAILVSGEPGRYPDALTANYLAGLRGAPVLLTQHDETPIATKQALRELGVENVIIVGGSAAVSDQQENTLDGTYTVRRISGEDRFATAAAVIAEGDTAQSDVALLATGMNFADALGGGAVAFAEKMPLAITKPTDAPDDVVAALKQAGIKKVLVLGGESAVGTEVVEELKADGITVEERFNGSDRAETSALLAEHAIAEYGFSTEAVNVASGYERGDGADALGGAALTGSQNRPLLITKSATNPGDGVIEYLDTAKPEGEDAPTEADKNLTEGLLFGGESAVTQAAELAMEKAVLGSGAQIGDELYDTVDEAIEAAEKDAVITVFGADNETFRVTKDDITIEGEDGAVVAGGITLLGADNVTVKGLRINVTAGNAITLNDVSDAVIEGNTIVGQDNVGNGVVSNDGEPTESATIRDNTFQDVKTGVVADDTSDFTITGNKFTRLTAGVAATAAATITGNEFLNNAEGIGLGVAGVTVEDNEFANNTPHVKDYTQAEADHYDLAAMIEANTFDEEVTVDETERAIVDAQ